MSSILPINLAGVALILLAIGLFVTDVFAPTHGVLTVGGAIAFFLGVMMMFDRAEPMLRLSMAVVLPATVVTVAFFAFVVGAGLRAQWRPHKAGSEALIGQVGRAVTVIGPARGKLLIEGEYWTAVSNDSISPDAYVEVVSREGLTLHVKPAAHAAGG
jgi:membrane-bound serine protease (ClpP class)